MKKPSILSLSAFAILLTGGVAMASPRASTPFGGQSHGAVQPNTYGGAAYAPGGTTVQPSTYGGAGYSRHGSAAQPSHRQGIFGSIRFGVGAHSGATTYGNYTNYQVQPQPMVETHQQVAGYVWIPGKWQWNGAQWVWTAGYYAAAPAASTHGSHW